MGRRGPGEGKNGVEVVREYEKERRTRGEEDLGVATGPCCGGLTLSIFKL